MTARIAGIGAYVPENIITNDDLAKIVDTNDEWIRTRTGIKERRISSGEGTRELAAKAAERALKAAGVSAEELDRNLLSKTDISFVIIIAHFILWTHISFINMKSVPKTDKNGRIYFRYK